MTLVRLAVEPNSRATEDGVVGRHIIVREPLQPPVVARVDPVMLEQVVRLDPPAELPLAMYPVVIEGGRVLIEIPEGPLAVTE